ncbi:MAG: phenylalanine--tRNA ligase subunit alpha [Acidobacteriota bacterium]|nr:phenylalanine--tRNA ligase subunit alpha [Acidobacteriota bacterium]
MDLTAWRYEDGIAAFRKEADAASGEEDWARLKNAYLSKKNGLVTSLLAGLREVSRELKPRLGKEINQFKKEVEATLKERAKVAPKRKAAGLDLTLPGMAPRPGSLHPLTLTLDDMLKWFTQMGYDISDGPEIETTFYNFEALNTPEDHPAREDADTFYIDDNRLLRTQTSGCQIRYMQTHTPPFRMVAPGKVFRRDDDATHSPMFHQLEGLVVGENISFGHLKGTLEAFARAMFGEEVTIRLRPSYFPFTEPSAEVDVTCVFCGNEPCRVCKGTGWIEILGSGMVDPNVFEAVGYDPDKYTGFAFGMGIERISMLRMQVPHIRYYFNNDRRFLDRFKVG